MRLMSVDGGRNRGNIGKKLRGVSLGVTGVWQDGDKMDY